MKRVTCRPLEPCGTQTLGPHQKTPVGTGMLEGFLGPFLWSVAVGGMKSSVAGSPNGCREKLPAESQTIPKGSARVIRLQRVPFAGNHIDIQKAWLCYRQLIQEFFTWKNWLEALSGSLDLILKLRRRQGSGGCSRLAKGRDEVAWGNRPYCFVGDHLWGRISRFRSASCPDGSRCGWLQLLQPSQLQAS